MEIEGENQNIHLNWNNTVLGGTHNPTKSKILHVGEPKLFSHFFNLIIPLFFNPKLTGCLVLKY